MKFPPPFQEIKASVTFVRVKGELTVRMSYPQFTTMIRTLLRGVEVDEVWYLNQYPDVAEAVRNGSITSSREHFLNAGYFEGRLPFPIKVDEKWYREQNPGVAKHISAGKLESAQQHFYENGYREGRRPFPR